MDRIKTVIGYDKEDWNPTTKKVFYSGAGLSVLGGSAFVLGAGLSSIPPALPASAGLMALGGTSIVGGAIAATVATNGYCGLEPAPFSLKIERKFRFEETQNDVKDLAKTFDMD